MGENIHMDENRNTLYIVGVGPGTGATLTDEARSLIAGCPSFDGGQRLLELAPEGAELHAITADLEGTRRFVAAGLEHSDVCVLASGDPGCFGILPYLKDNFADRIQVAPGISSLQIMAARLHLSWQDWRLVSLHGRTAELAPLPDLSLPTLYFCDASSAPQVIAKSLPPALADRRAAIGCDLGLPEEQIWQGRLADVVLLSFPGNSLFLILPEEERNASGDSDGMEARRSASAPGIPDELWLRGEGIPLSKSEVRAVLLAKAQPRGRRVIWDSGAGTGSYGIECSLIEPGARVYSIDKNSEACELASRNARRFGAVIETVSGEAPDCFGGLPRPDLVIVGGNDGRLEKIFQGALEALAPGGRILVTALLEQTKKVAHDLFAHAGLEGRSVTRVSIARGEATQWLEHNPVIIFSGDKPRADEASAAVNTGR